MAIKEYIFFAVIIRKVRESDGSSDGMNEGSANSSLTGELWMPSSDVLSGLRAPFILTLWFYSFAINTHGWRRGGVNNVLIFEFDPRNYLDFVQLGEVSFILREDSKTSQLS